MTSPEITFRSATAADAAVLLAWRNHPRTRQFSHQKHEITLDEHTRWFERIRADPRWTVWIASHGEQLVGVVRFEQLEGDSARVHIALDPDHQGKGVGTAVLARGTPAYAASSGARRVRAEIESANVASIRAFQKAGYVAASDVSPGVLAFEWRP